MRAIAALVCEDGGDVGQQVRGGRRVSVPAPLNLGAVAGGLLHPFDPGQDGPNLGQLCCGRMVGGGGQQR